MKYQLSDGNIIVADADFIAKHYPDAVPIDEPAPEPAAYTPEPLTRLQFRSLFTTAEKVSIEMAMLDDPSTGVDYRKTAAFIRSFDKDLQAAEFVDLGDPRVIAGVQMLESAGLIGAGRATEILSNDRTN